MNFEKDGVKYELKSNSLILFAKISKKSEFSIFDIVSAFLNSLGQAFIQALNDSIFKLSCEMDKCRVETCGKDIVRFILSFNVDWKFVFKFSKEIKILFDYCSNCGACHIEIK